MEHPKRTPVEQRFFGTAVSRGIAVGHAVILDGTSVPDPIRSEPPPNPAREAERFRRGFEKASAELSELAVADASGIFQVHLLILEDAFGDAIEHAIMDGGYSAESAVRTRARELVERQRSVADSHIREKYLDIDDVAERLINALKAESSRDPSARGTIYIISQLTPSRLSELAARRPQGIISDHGGWTSHTSILAREYKLPAVTGVVGLHNVVKDGDLLILDGFTGTVILDPEPNTLGAMGNAGMSRRRVTAHDVEPDTETSDGVEIKVRVNANLPDVYDRAHRAGAQGIGLYRSELLFDRHDAFPSEEEQYQAYREIADAVGEAGVRIRTFDIGVDRLPLDPRHDQRNPSLGLRAVRYSLTEPETFKAQVRAILRASSHRNIDLVLPMISGVEDVVRLHSIINEEKSLLMAAGVEIGDPKLGVMIETPSAVASANHLARHVDAFCLGTNDLVQYMLAVDRDEPSVAEWYQTLHPAVIAAIRSVIEVGKTAGTPVAVCGEMAGATYYVPLLIGLGARELSMNVNSIDAVRAVITDLDTFKCSRLADLVSAASTSDEADIVMKEFYSQHWPHLNGISA